MKKEEYVSYWLGVLEAADEIRKTFTGNSRLSILMRQLATNRVDSAIQELSKVGWKADVAMEISRRGFMGNATNWEQRAVDEIIEEEEIDSSKPE